MARTTTDFPTLHVIAESIPKAHYRAMRMVWHMGLSIRTEYDRSDSEGNYLDPPSKDARVLIEVKRPFSQPRYPVASFCEIGTYIAEIMGVKDHLVVPFRELLLARSEDLKATEWPYTYHQRLFSYPDLSKSTNVDQVELMLERVAETPFTRRAVASTSVPIVDPFLKEDVPCLREIQLRIVKDSQGINRLNMTTTWRSRDLFKAWADNVIALTFLQQVWAHSLSIRMSEPVEVGSYADFSSSLHIYGQDFTHVEGDQEKGIRSFFDMNEDQYVEKAFSSKAAAEMLVIPQLKKLLQSEAQRQWQFPEDARFMIARIIDMIQTCECQA